MKNLDGSNFAHCSPENAPMIISPSFTAFSTAGRRYRLSYKLPLAVFLCLIASRSWAQQKNIDSLEVIVKTGVQDRRHLEALLLLVNMIHEAQPQRGLELAKKAVLTAIEKNYNDKIPAAYNSIGSIYQILAQYDSSILYHRKAKALAVTNNNSLELAEAYRGIGAHHMQLNDADSAEYYFKKELTLAQKIKNAVLMAGAHNDLGNLYLEKNKFDASLKEYIKAAAIYDSGVHDNTASGKALANIGNVECMIEHYSKALEYANQAIAIFQRTKNDLGTAYCLRLRVRIYRKQTLYAKALQQYEQVLRIYDHLADKRSMSEALQNMGNIYYDIGEFKKALHRYEESLLIARSIGSRKQIAYCYSALGCVWNKLKNEKKALAFTDSSYSVAKQLDDRNLMTDAFEVRSEIYADEHNYRAALEELRALSSLKDTLNQATSKREGEEMEALYQSSRKQAQIDLLQKDKLLQAATLRQQHLRFIALAIALSLTIIISLLLFNRYAILNESRRQLEMERMRNAVARDLHDNIGSTLSSINIISQVALTENKPDNFQYHFQRIGEQSLKMMENMSDMVWSINPSNDSMEKMIIRLKEFSTEILEPKNIGYTFEGEEIFQVTKLNVGERKNIFLILKEAINNAAKYSAASAIHIAISKIENHLLLVVRDNGKGFDQANVQRGNGLNNMYERAKEIGGTVDLETSCEGTIIRIRTPLT